MDAHLSTEKKPLASKFPFHDESLARKSKFLEQSGGGGGVGWVGVTTNSRFSRAFA